MGIIPLDKIRVSSLPPELVIDNFIDGYKEVSYEDYLTEFVNHSALFLSLSQGESYKHTPHDQQSDGECDCHTRQYELDFKLLVTQSGIYAKRNLSLQKAYLAKGLLATFPPRQTEGMEITKTGNLLRRFNLDELLDIDRRDVQKFDRDQLCPETDVKNILKVAKCKKNTLFYLTDYIFSVFDYPICDVIETVQSYLTERFVNLFRFRDRFVADKDTYLAVIIQGYLCIALWREGSIQFSDSIPLSKSSTFTDLCGTISNAYRTTLKMN